ncbi:MAG: MgtC/SapB family protein [Deltaproteobacteria bacterium]|nr:MgtC/SapB family protein [Deltaproteobacteria bacterium]
MSDSSSIIEFLMPLAVAAMIGLLLGLEREMAHKPAGLRTQFLVAVATALFVLSAKTLGRDDVGKIAANVLTGLGFLGAGVILEHRGTVRGLTTAALIWANGALSLTAALGNYYLAATGAAITLIALPVLGAVERKMATKCGVFRYQVTARETAQLAQTVRDALSHCHFQEGPLTFDRQDGKVVMRFAFCNPPTRHQEFVTSLQKIPDVLDIKME